MDNDLMARRLRPPSEPTQPPPSPAPSEQPDYADDQSSPGYHSWPAASAPNTQAPPPWAAAEDPSAVEVAPWLEGAPAFDEPPAVEVAPAYGAEPVYEAAPAYETQRVYEAPVPAPVPPATQEPPPWDRAAREEVPWDRPMEYDQPTDSATPGQPSWDRPAAEEWTDTGAFDDRTPEMFDPNSDAGRTMPIAWPEQGANQMAAVASAPSVVEAPAVEAAAADPDDAYAPVLADIAVPARAWPEMNGHEASRNEATVSAEAIAQGQATMEVESVIAETEAHSNWDDAPGTDPAQEWGVPSDEQPFFALEQPAPASEQEALAPEQPDPAPEHTDQALEQSPVGAEAQAPQQPIVVRIELAIVDDSRRLDSPADAAWRVNDVNAVVLDAADSDLSADSERVTPRHPAFQPRGNNGDEHVDAGHAHQIPAEIVPADPDWIEPTVSGAAAEAWVPPPTNEAQQWFEPSAAPIHAAPAPAAPPAYDGQPAPWPGPANTPATPEPAAAPWAPTVQPPWADEQLVSHPAPAVQAPGPFAPPTPRGADVSSADVSPWVQPGRSVDPLASLPAAPAPSATPFAPAPSFVSSAQAAPHVPMYADPPAGPVVQAARQIPAQSAFAPPVYEDFVSAPAPATPHTVASAQAATVAAQEQSDLWFLSTEPDDVDDPTEKEVAEGKDSSAVLTAVLTIGMAVLVIVLVLVFFQLMTSLLG